MSSVVEITVRIKNYSWKEFVHEVEYGFVYTILLANALSKEYFHLNLLQLAKITLKFLYKAFWSFMIGIWIYLLIGGLLEQFK